MEADAFATEASLGTLGMAAADLDGDRRVDVVEAQGEVPGHEAERVYLATHRVPPDTAPPVVAATLREAEVLARIHDNRAPNLPHDWRSTVVSWPGRERPLTWYGENLFRAPVPSTVRTVDVCATDVAGNRRCVRVRR
jgi:hypothetical protein